MINFLDRTDVEEYLRTSNPVGRPKGSKNASFLYFTDYHTRKVENEQKTKPSSHEEDSSNDSEGEEFYHPFEPVYKYKSRRSVATRYLLTFYRSFATIDLTFQFRKIESVSIDSNEDTTRRVTRSQTNQIKSKPVPAAKNEKNLESQTLFPTDSPPETDSAFNFDPSSENLCEIVPHIDNPILNEHILTIIARRFGLGKHELETYLAVDRNDHCVNDNELIPGLHEKFTIFIRDFRSIFHDKTWLTSEAVEAYINLILMAKVDENTSLVSHGFQFFLDKHQDITTWNALEFNRHCKSPFGCDIKDADFVVIPSCIDRHFILTYLDVQSRKAYYFDSAYSKHRISHIENWLPMLTEFIWKNSTEWELIHDPESIIQPDGSSCGIYVCMAARRHILNDVMLIPTPAWQYRARLTMSLSLLCTKLLPI